MRRQSGVSGKGWQVELYRSVVQQVPRSVMQRKDTESRSRQDGRRNAVRAALHVPGQVKVQP